MLVLSGSVESRAPGRSPPSASVPAARFVLGALLTLVGVSAACGGTGQAISSNADAGGAESLLTGAGGGPAKGPGAGAPAGFTAAETGVGGAPGNAYPFLFAHGFFGFENFAGQDYITYFYKVKERLAQDGISISTPSVDPFNDSDFRGAELILRIQAVLAETGATKVNIIAHSQGGLDARVAAHERPDLVASVVTIATPHHGTPVADVAMKLLGNPNADQVIDDLGQLLGGPLYDQIGDKTSLSKPMYLFSKAGIAAFNLKYPDAPGVFYASIAGRSSSQEEDEDCVGDLSLQFITQWDRKLDPVDPLLMATSALLGPGANDGLIRAADARWGEFWGCVPADHLDEIGQILGDGPGFGNPWSHLSFYSQLVQYVRQRGY